MLFPSDQLIRSKKYSYLPLENKKRNVEMDSVASGGDHGKYVKYVNSLRLRLWQHCRFLAALFVKIGFSRN
jgi:hypothetical protein